MESIHIRDIQRWLASDAQAGVAHGSTDPFLEIRFDEPGDRSLDEEMRNKVITCDSPQGSVTIQFDDSGWLRSIDIC